MTTAIFIVSVAILVLAAYTTAQINRILNRVDEIMTTVARIFNLCKP